MTAAAARRWWDALAVYADRRLIIVFFMGFASGLPLPLSGATLSIWLTEAGVSLASIGLFSGSDEVCFMAEWNEEFEPFPGRIGGDVVDFNDSSPLGLEEWMFDSGCVLALGDGRGLNFATLDVELATRLRARFRPAR